MRSAPTDALCRPHPARAAAPRGWALVAAAAILALAGCGTTPQAIDRDPVPGLFLKGDVARVRQGKVSDWMLLTQKPREILWSTGVGTLWGAASLGDFVVVGGRAYVKTTSEETRRVLGDSDMLFRTPFSFGVARSRARVLSRQDRKFADPVDLDHFIEALGGDVAFWALAECGDLSGRVLQAPPIAQEPLDSKPDVYFSDVSLSDVATLLVGVVVRDTEANRKDAARAQILRDVFAVDVAAGTPSGKTYRYVTALTLDRRPSSWPEPDALAGSVSDYRYKALFTVRAATIRRAVWETFAADHINPPPGRRYIEPSRFEGPTPYIPLPPAD